MINVVKYRGYCALFSAILMASFVGVGIYRYQTRGQVFTYSVDFTGGTQVLFKFGSPVSGNHVKTILQQAGWPHAVVRDFSSQEMLVRVGEYSNDAKGLGDRMRQALITGLEGNSIEILQTEIVGPGVGSALRWKSMRAVLIGLLAMLFYIAISFWSLAFSVGAVVALFHDALVMLATFLFIDREISVNVILAILTVIGYSINDTIVIFSRIRDTMRKSGGAMSLEEIVNVSINQTLRRTLLTSISTGLTVGAMLLLGGEALRDISLALLVGIIFGTYSSVYIASPVMMLLYRKER